MPTVVWWPDEAADDWRVESRLAVIRWLEFGGRREGRAIVPLSRCNPRNPDDPLIPVEVLLQAADHFAGPILILHASNHADDLDPFTRLRAAGHRMIFKDFARQEPEFRGGVTAEDSDGAVSFTVVLADNLPATEEEQVAEWAWTMIRTFLAEGPARWIPKGERRWQILNRVARRLNDR